jgi:hypothetical protein
LLALIAVATSFAACSAPAAPGSTSATSAAPTTPSGSAADPTVGATATATGGGSGGGTGKPAVDLTFSGEFAFTAKGSAGQCQIGQQMNGGLVFGFIAEDADYPGIGTLQVSEDSASHKVSIKLIPPTADPWFGYLTGGATLSADHKSITLDADLPTSVGRAPEHLTGSIACP